MRTLVEMFSFQTDVEVWLRPGYLLQKACCQPSLFKTKREFQLESGLCIGCTYSKKMAVDSLRHIKKLSPPSLAKAVFHRSPQLWADLQGRYQLPQIHPQSASHEGQWVSKLVLPPSLTSPAVISSHTMIRGAAFKTHPLRMSPHDLQVLRRQLYNLCSQLACSLGLGLHQLSLFLGLRVKSHHPQQRQTTPPKKALTYLYIPVFVKLHEGSIKNQKPTDFQNLEYFQDSVLLQPSWVFFSLLFLSLFSAIRGSSFASEYLLVLLWACAIIILPAESLI